MHEKLKLVQVEVRPIEACIAVSKAFTRRHREYFATLGRLQGHSERTGRQTGTAYDCITDVI